MKIIICGATGFIGRNLLEFFNRDGNEIIAVFNKSKPFLIKSGNVKWIYADLRLPGSIKEYLEGTDVLLQFAATTSGSKDIVERPYIHVTDAHGGALGLEIATNNIKRLTINSQGHVVPGADNTYNLGTATSRWANIYSADIHCSNKGSKNDVDGTWGDFTIQEGESNLFLINNRSGKKYKFNLTEVN